MTSRTTSEGSPLPCPPKKSSARTTPTRRGHPAPARRTAIQAANGVVPRARRHPAGGRACGRHVAVSAAPPIWTAEPQARPPSCHRYRPVRLAPAEATEGKPVAIIDLENKAPDDISRQRAKRPDQPRQLDDAHHSSGSNHRHYQGHPKRQPRPCNNLQRAANPRRYGRPDKDPTSHSPRRRDGSANVHGQADRRVPLQQPSCREYTSCRLRSPLRWPGASKPQEKAGHPGRPARTSPPKPHWGGFGTRREKEAGRCAPETHFVPLPSPVGGSGELKEKGSPPRAAGGRRTTLNTVYFIRKSQLSRMRKRAEIWAKTRFSACFRLVST